MKKTEARPGDSRLAECSQCEGHGYYHAPKKKECPTCKGKGFVVRDRSDKPA